MVPQARNDLNGVGGSRAGPETLPTPLGTAVVIRCPMSYTARRVPSLVHLCICRNALVHFHCGEWGTGFRLLSCVCSKCSE